MNESWFEKIEDYLNGKMSREERILFESEMASNEELYAAFKLYQTIETEMSDQEKHSLQEAELKSSLENLNDRYFKLAKVIPVEELDKVRRINPWKIIAIAASIIGLVFLGTIWYIQRIKDSPEIAVDQSRIDTTISPSGQDTIKKNIPLEVPENEVKTPNKKLDSRQEPVRAKSGKDAGKDNKKSVDAVKLEALFADNFEPDTVPARKAGPLQNAFHHYETGEYNDAIAAMEKANLDVVARGSKADKKLATFYMYYYKGLSYLAAGQATKAIPVLEVALADSPDASYKAKAQWYLSLAYLKVGKSDKSGMMLNLLARNQEAGIYQNKAIKLRNKLKEN